MSKKRKELKRLKKLTSITKFYKTKLHTKKLGDINRIYDSLTCKNIITYEEFDKYLKVGNKILNTYGNNKKLIEISNAIMLRGKRYTNFISSETNKQFIQLKKNGITADVYISLFEMLSRFMSVKSVNKLIDIITNENLDDIEIFKKIKIYYHQDRNSLNKPSNMEYKLIQITDIMEKFIVKDNTSSTLLPKVLDIGVGNGSKLKFIKKHFNCTPYGADIVSWGSYSENNRKFDFTFKEIQMVPEYKIPYESNMFDCITLSLVLHHVHDIIVVLKECKRLLKKNGIIVIIEHDVWTDNDNLIIELEHRLFEYLYNEPKNSHRGCYYNFYEWDILFNKCDYEPIYGVRWSEDIGHHLKFDSKYIAVYKNK